MNFLEQLVSEWYEYEGYFVRRNVHVGKRPNGGWEGELDVVAFHPKQKLLVHIEPSMDSDSWTRREARFKKKFEAGRRYIPDLFEGIETPDRIEQIALFGLGSKANNPTLAGGKVMLIDELLQIITNKLKTKRVEKEAVPEQFPLLRTIQFMCQHGSKLFGQGKINHEQVIKENIQDKTGKTCSICGKWFPYSEFVYGGRENRSYCQKCDKEEKAAYAIGGAEAARKYREKIRSNPTEK